MNKEGNLSAGTCSGAASTNCPSLAKSVGSTFKLKCALQCAPTCSQQNNHCSALEPLVSKDKTDFSENPWILIILGTNLIRTT